MMFASYRQLSRNTFTVAASIGAVLAAFFAWQPLLALRLRELGADDVQIGAAFSIFILANTIPAMAGGMLADRIGRKWVAFGPGVFLSPLYLLASQTRDWTLLVGILIFTNALGGVQWPAMQALISESDPEHRATAFSLIEIFVMSAGVIGPFVGSLLLPVLGFSGLILLHGIVLIPMTIVRARAVRETHHATARLALTRTDWRGAISPTVARIILANGLFVLALNLTIAGPFAPILMRDAWSLTDQQIQQVTSLGSLAAFGGIWLGSKADQWGSRRVRALAASGLAVALVGWGLSPNVQVGLGFVLAAYLFDEALFIVSETLLAQHTARTTRSFLFGLNSTVSGAAGAGGPALGGWLVALSRLAAPFIAGGLVSLLSFAAVARVDNRSAEEQAMASAAE